MLKTKFLLKKVKIKIKGLINRPKYKALNLFIYFYLNKGLYNILFNYNKS